MSLEKMFLETDEADNDIRELYEVLANLRDISVENLKGIISENAKRVLGG